MGRGRETSAWLKYCLWAVCFSDFLPFYFSHFILEQSVALSNGNSFLACFKICSCLIASTCLRLMDLSMLKVPKRKRLNLHSHILLVIAFVPDTSHISLSKLNLDNDPLCQQRPKISCSKFCLHLKDLNSFFLFFVMTSELWSFLVYKSSVFILCTILYSNVSDICL